MKEAIYLFCLILLVSCGDKSYEIIKTDGVKTILNKKVPPAAKIKVEFTKKYEIKDENLRKPVAIQYNGKSIFVNDFGANKILKYDNQGKFITSFGRIGSGPGEFQQGPQICLKKDTVFVFSEDKRVSKFNLAGKYLTSGRIDSYPVMLSHIANSNKYLGYEIKFNPSKDNQPEIDFYLNLYNKNLDKLKDFSVLKQKIKDMAKFDILDGISYYSINNNNIFVAEKSKDQIAIMAYKQNGELDYKIKNSYRKISFTKKEIEEINQFYTRENGMKSNLSKDFKFAVQTILCDYHNNLWAVVPCGKEKYRIDIFKDGILKASMDYPEFLPKKIIHEKVLMFKNCIFVIEDDDFISVYEYELNY